MSTFIVVADGRGWYASNFTYDAAIEVIAAELTDAPGAAELKEWLLLQTCRQCGPGIGTVDLRELAPADRELFEDAVLRAVVTVAEMIPPGWDPVAFPRWHEYFKILAQLIGSTRNREPPESFAPHGHVPPSGRRVGPGWKRAEG